MLAGLTRPPSTWSQGEVWWWGLGVEGGGGGVGGVQVIAKPRCPILSPALEVRASKERCRCKLDVQRAACTPCAPATGPSGVGKAVRGDCRTKKRSVHADELTQVSVRGDGRHGRV